MDLPDAHIRSLMGVAIFVDEICRPLYYLASYFN